MAKGAQKAMGAAAPVASAIGDAAISSIGPAISSAAGDAASGLASAVGSGLSNAAGGALSAIPVIGPVVGPAAAAIGTGISTAAPMAANLASKVAVPAIQGLGRLAYQGVQSGLSGAAGLAGVFDQSPMAQDAMDMKSAISMGVPKIPELGSRFPGPGSANMDTPEATMGAAKVPSHVSEFMNQDNKSIMGNQQWSGAPKGPTMSDTPTYGEMGGGMAPQFKQIGAPPGPMGPPAPPGKPGMGMNHEFEQRRRALAKQMAGNHTQGL
jgi:hypothetical protein